MNVTVISSSSPEIKISVPGSDSDPKLQAGCNACAFQDDDLKLIWLQNKRPAIYDSGILHGYNCLCCPKVPKESIIRSKSKLGLKAGGHNTK